MSYSLNPERGLVWGIIYDSTLGGLEGDSRSLDYSSNALEVYLNSRSQTVGTSASPYAKI